jgi:hypothetical protein
MSGSEVYQNILDLEPDYVVMLGDFHYSGHYGMTERDFKFAVHEVMKQP